MKLPDNWGIVITVSWEDVMFAKGLCASIHHFMGPVPITLLCDGNFSVLDFQRAYDVQVMRAHDVRDAFLAENSFGYGFSKFIAVWEAPYSQYLHLDADMIMWGNLLKTLNGNNYQEYDILAAAPYFKVTLDEMKFQLFDPEALAQHTTVYPWQSVPFFNSGVYWAKRGFLSLDRYKELKILRHHHREIFRAGEQGMLNFMVFEGVSECRLKFKSVHELQVVVPNYSENDLRSRFPLELIISGKDTGPATMLHWVGGPGNKPYAGNRKRYYEIQKYFQQRFHNDAGRCSVFFPVRYLHDNRVGFNSRLKIGEKIADRLPIIRKSWRLKSWVAQLIRVLFWPGSWRRIESKYTMS